MVVKFLSRQLCMNFPSEQCPTWDSPFRQRRHAWVVSDGQLNTSLSLGAYTAVLSNPSYTGTLVYHNRCGHPPRITWQTGRFFSGLASGLDAFSPYRLGRSCPAVPFRTTGTPSAPTSRSSRTEDPLGGQPDLYQLCPLPSSDQHSR